MSREKKDKKVTSHSNKQIYRKRNHLAVVLVLLVCVAILVGILVGVVSWILQVKPGEAPSSSVPPATAPTTTTTHISLPKEFLDANTASKAVALYDVSAGKLLYSKNADEKREPASLTKLLTAILAIEHCPEGFTFVVGDELNLVDYSESSVSGLRKGQTFSLDGILQALLIPSGNDAAYTIAANIGRQLAGDANLKAQAAVNKFCDQMNTTAAALGAIHTHFSNPDGLPDDNHYTTANDILKIAVKAMSYPQIAQTVSMPRTTDPQLGARANTNLLLDPTSVYYYAYATGMKTGFTDDAGYCLAVSAEKNGRQLIAILMGAENVLGRWEDARGLMELAYRE